MYGSKLSADCARSENSDGRGDPRGDSRHSFKHRIAHVRGQRRSQDEQDAARQIGDESTRMQRKNFNLSILPPGPFDDRPGTVAEQSEEESFELAVCGYEAENEP